MDKTESVTRGTNENINHATNMNVEDLSHVTHMEVAQESRPPSSKENVQETFVPREQPEHFSDDAFIAMYVRTVAVDFNNTSDDCVRSFVSSLVSCPPSSAQQPQYPFSRPQDKAFFRCFLAICTNPRSSCTQFLCTCMCATSGRLRHRWLNAVTTFQRKTLKSTASTRVTSASGGNRLENAKRIRRICSRTVRLILRYYYISSA